ncbi:MAG: sulfotransferase family protein [Planctomycetota bacterium]|jgi:hypothetical protein
MRPNYLVIGAQKCATSSLCALLGSHPDIFMTDPKEPYFFSHPELWARGWEWYESLFDAAQRAVAVGEGSTTYTQRLLYPEAAPRIAEFLPEARLIYIVREPMERIRSHWMHNRARPGKERLPFNAAVHERPEYIDNSLYYKQISIYRQHFSDDRILILFFEDFRRDPAAVLKSCFEFLAVNPQAPLEANFRPRHVSSEGYEDRAVLAPLRRLPFFDLLRKGAPNAMRDILVRTLKRPIGPRPEWDDSTRQWAHEQLADESRAFLARYGKPADFWQIAGAPFAR